MMNILFSATTSGDAENPDVAELCEAIDVFGDTELISADAAKRARERVTAGGDTFTGRRPIFLAAV